MIVLREATLFYSEGSADKYYHIILKKDGEKHSVSFDYGRRGQTGTYGSKVVDSTYEKADKAFWAIIKEKSGKGYTTDPSGKPFSGIDIDQDGEKESIEVKIPAKPIDDGYGPQLLNSIDEDRMNELMNDDEWCAQEKFDGKRMTLRYENKKLQATNKKGQPCGCPELYNQTLIDSKIKSVIFDGESIGEEFFVYDILECNGKDLRVLSYLNRCLFYMNLPCIDKPFHMVMEYSTAPSKKSLYNYLKTNNKEGIVFKRLNATHKAGRPSSGGDQLKFKFTATASCRVMKLNDKSSVQLGLHDGKSWVNVGNCTVPAKKVPSIDDVIEVRYLYAYKGGSLFQPVFIRVRDDADWMDCQITQLKYKAE